MLEALQFLATLSAALFRGRGALHQWAPSYRRATWMQAPLAVISFLTAVGAWLLGGAVVWLIAALFIGAVVPITFIAALPP